MIMGAAGERFAKQSKLSIYLLPGLALLGWKSCGYSVMEEMGAGSLCPTSRRPEIGSGELVAQEDQVVSDDNEPHSQLDLWTGELTVHEKLDQETCGLTDSHLMQFQVLLKKILLGVHRAEQLMT